MKVTVVEATCREEFANVRVQPSVRVFHDRGYRQRVTTAPGIGAGAIFALRRRGPGTGLLPGECARAAAYVTVNGGA